MWTFSFSSILAKNTDFPTGFTLTIVLLHLRFIGQMTSHQGDSSLSLRLRSELMIYWLQHYIALQSWIQIQFSISFGWREFSHGVFPNNSYLKGFFPSILFPRRAIPKGTFSKGFLGPESIVWPLNTIKLEYLIHTAIITFDWMRSIFLQEKSV